jgi:hypothetical protein
VHRIGTVNPRADDNVTWYPMGDGVFKPVRAMINSWKPAMESFASVWHESNQSVIINDHVHRIDMMKSVDGIFAEMADIDAAGWTHGFGSALAGIRKPVWLWNHPKDDDIPLDTLEQALQAHLYIGVYPMLPVRNNDHAIGGMCAPNCPYDQIYLDYGPLFQGLKGKQWLLTANAVESSTGLANAFYTATGFAAVVIEGGESKVEVHVRLPQGTKQPSDVLAVLPGIAQPASTSFSFNSTTAELVVDSNLVRGCVLLNINMI